MYSEHIIIAVLILAGLAFLLIYETRKIDSAFELQRVMVEKNSVEFRKDIKIIENDLNRGLISQAKCMKMKSNA